MKTAESSRASKVSAMASFRWLDWPGVTVAVQISTTVSPSISVLIVGARFAGGTRALFRKNSGLCGVGSSPGKGLPLLIVLIDTGALLPGRRAQFLPLMKKAKTSLNG